MYRDKTLIPAEAIRLAALGTLALAPARYSDVAREVRGFAARIAGPSLDILGSSLELLRHEGLVAAEDGGEDPRLELTAKGREALETLLTANVRSPTDGVSKLVLALKLRFLHLLPAAAQREQIAVIVEMSEQERARLADLAGQLGDNDGLLGSWLAHELAQVDGRIAWLNEVAAGL